MPTFLINLLSVAMAGALGAVARWLSGMACDAWLGKSWPWATLVINSLGCLLFGLLFAWSARWGWSEQHPGRLFVFTGFLGAYTTFSTFAWETFQLHSTSHIAWAMLNIIAQVALGLLLVSAGLLLGKLV